MKLGTERTDIFLQAVFAIGALIVAIGLVFIYQGSLQALPLKEYLPKNQTNAVWDWGNFEQRSDQDLRDQAQFLYLHQIQVLFLAVEVPYEEVNAGTRSTRREEIEKNLERTIRIMQDKNIRVFVMGGDVEWSKPDQRFMPLALQRFTHEFNEKHEKTRISGIEYDIESYNQTHFEQASMTEKSLVLMELLDTVHELVEQEKKQTGPGKLPLELGFAVPYWFDNENGNIPSVRWRDKTGPAIYHIADTLNQLPESNIVVMSYRSAAAGSDGSIFHARTEVEYAEQKAPRVNVYVGQEVTDVEPEKITFYGKTMDEFSSEQRVIGEAFSNFSSFEGAAINDLEGLYELSK